MRVYNHKVIENVRDVDVNENEILMRRKM